MEFIIRGGVGIWILRISATFAFLALNPHICFFVVEKIEILVLASASFIFGLRIQSFCTRGFVNVGDSHLCCTVHLAMYMCRSGPPVSLPVHDQ